MNGELALSSSSLFKDVEEELAWRTVLIDAEEKPP
jgi:hypothetical protein